MIAWRSWPGIQSQRHQRNRNQLKRYTEPSAEVKSHAAEKHLTFAILKDEGNKIADRLGANRTPEVYVLDASMKLVYHGRIDNSQKVEGITSNDVRDAG
jgi:hypothetical protein